MNTVNTIANIKAGALDARLTALYGAEALEAQKARYLKAIEAFEALYGKDLDISLLSVAGRSELSGNHTDHNRGMVIAASIDLDIVAVAAKTEGSVVRVKSEGYPEDVVDISDFCAPRGERFSKSDAIVAGMCAGLAKNGYRTGGFVAYTTSSVL